MPYSIQIQPLPAGFAVTSARKGENVAICYREFTSSEDGDSFINRLDGIVDPILSKLDALSAIKPSTIDHLIAVIKSDGSAVVYVNELSFLGKVRVRRAVEKGDPVFEDDFIDIDSIRFPGLEIPTDAGVVVLLSKGWRKGLYFDFGPLIPHGSNREHDLERVLGGVFSYLTFQHYFKISDDDWLRLLEAQWFPFIGLDRSTLFELLNHVRSKWDIDGITNTVAESVLKRISVLREAWSSQPFLADQRDLLCHALDKFAEKDYISATAILYPQIEGLLREMQSYIGGTSFKQGLLAQAPSELAAQHVHNSSRLLPARFREFLEKVYFASFKPGDALVLSRHTIAHGVAPTHLFSMKAAALAILIVEQLFFHVPPTSPPEA